MAIWFFTALSRALLTVPKCNVGTQKWLLSPVVQWLRLCVPSVAGPGSIPGHGTRSHMPQLRVQMPELLIRDPSCCNEGRRSHVP